MGSQEFEQYRYEFYRCVQVPSDIFSNCTTGYATCFSTEDLCSPAQTAEELNKEALKKRFE